MDNWTSTEVMGGAPVLRQIGPLGLWLRRNLDEWHVGVDRRERTGPVTADSQPDPDPEMEWERSALGSEFAEVTFVPVMPDRPIVVRPEHEIQVAKGADCLLYVSVPVWVRLSVGEGGKYTIGEYPTMLLSNTWFGDPTEGELCYSVKTTARRSLKDMSIQPHRAICPVKIKNESDEFLELERICLRVEHLSIYSSDGRLWAPDASLSYLGDDKFSRVEFASAVKPNGHDAKKLGPARQDASSNIILRSFGRIRDLAHLRNSW